MARIPNDVLIHILLRLPVKSLLRFRSVCKSWYTLISSSFFITAHRNYITAAGDSRTLIIRRCGPGTRQFRYTLHLNDESLTEITNFDSPSTNPNDVYRILSSVNGLICLLNLDFSLMIWNPMIWNPMIRKHLIIPYPSTPIAYPSLPLYGFGFDPLTDDYKIVRVAYHPIGVFVEIYRLRSNSWSRVELGETEHIFPLLLPKPAYLNGAIHWIANDYTVARFDLCTETFMLMDSHFPWDLKDKSFKDVFIVDWCGLLALVEFGDSKTICLWVMKEYSNSDSWTRQCTISCVSVPQMVKGVTSNGKILIQDSMGLLFWFDPTTRGTAELIVQEIGDVESFHVKAYAESLVLLAGRDI